MDRLTWHRRLGALAIAAAFWASGAGALSEPATIEAAAQLRLRHALRFEAQAALTLVEATDLGVGFGLAYEFRVIAHLGLMARYGATFFPGEQRLEGEAGAYHGFGLALRLHPAPRLDRGDLWLTAGADLALLGGERRLAITAALGFDFQIARFLRVGPYLAYLHLLPTERDLPLAGGLGLVQLGVALVGLLGADRREAPDRDGDKLRDPVDECPDDPEDFDRFRDEDGCPDPDNDRDGVPDVDDRCPLDPEDRDGDRDEDGCPEDPGDRDGDSLADPDDRCPDDPEDLDLFEDDDGCPDLDDDRDGVLDVDDRCPYEPEVRNGFEDDDGCPDELPPGLVELRQLGERVLFGNDDQEPVPSSLPALEQVAALVRQHPGWTRVLVAGHASDSGAAEYNLALSLRRARRVRELLVERFGVEAGRLRVEGFGETQPDVAGETEEARSRNRRVVFTVEQ